MATAEPVEPQRTGTYSGRKFITSPVMKSFMRPKSSPMQRSSQRTMSDYTNAGKTLSRSKTRQTNIEDLERILALDTATIQNVRKEIDHAQKEEVAKAMKILSRLKRESDSLIAINELKERELANILDENKCHEFQISTNTALMNATRAKIKNLNEQQVKIYEKIAAEQRTRKMLNLMYTRNEKEIESFRMEYQSQTAIRDSKELELKSLLETVRLGKQDIQIEEHHLDVLIKARKNRQEDRTNKILQMRSIVADGELSVSKMSSSLFEGSRVCIIIKYYAIEMYEYVYINMICIFFLMLLMYCIVRCS